MAGSAGEGPQAPEAEERRLRTSSPPGRRRQACGVDAGRGQARCLPRPPPAATATKLAASMTAVHPKARPRSASTRVAPAAVQAGGEAPSPLPGRRGRESMMSSGPLETASHRPAGPSARLRARFAPGPREQAAHWSPGAALEEALALALALRAAWARWQGLAGGCRAVRNRAVARAPRCLREAREPALRHWPARRHSEPLPPPGGLAASCRREGEGSASRVGR